MGRVTRLRAASWDAERIGSRPGAVFRVQAVFSRVANLLSEGGLLCAVVQAELDDAPRTVRLAEGERLPRLGVGDTVWIGADRESDDLVVGLVVDLFGAAPWTPARLSLAGAGAAGLADLALELERAVRRRGARGGLAGPPADATVFQGAVARRLAEGASAFERAVSTGDRAGAEEQARALLGLGPGLTPAGDDFLAGFALVASAGGSGVEWAAEMLGGLAESGVARTTPLGAATLAEAAVGRGRSILYELLAAGIVAGASGEPGAFAPGGRLDWPIEHALAIGHTSGADLVSGLAAGLRAAAVAR